MSSNKMMITLSVLLGLFCAKRVPPFSSSEPAVKQPSARELQGSPLLLKEPNSFEGGGMSASELELELELLWANGNP